jgi:hypothetical protein
MIHTTITVNRMKYITTIKELIYNILEMLKLKILHFRL